MRGLVFVLTVVVMVACAREQPVRGAAGGSDAAEPIPVAAELDPETAAWLAEATNAFGFDLLAELDDGGNVILSPTSVAVVLTMLLNGASGETAERIAETLHVAGRNEVAINAAYASLLATLQATDEVELAIANSLWADAGTPFEPSYLERMLEGFAATVDNVDLGAPEASERIDAWVREETRELIDGIAKDLGLPNPQAVLVLLNAVYFKGVWSMSFDPTRTRDGEFTRPDGTTVTVPMMSRDDEIAHGRGDGFEIVRLPYGEDERFAMEIILPDGPLETVPLDAEAWAAATEALTEKRVVVTMPRFELEYATENGALDNALRNLGMGIAYGGESDFTRMSPVDPWLSTVVHKTYIRVDEEGTEAAAVTGGVMEVSRPPEFAVDRPFLFTISDADTDTILFLGAVTDPSAQ